MGCYTFLREELDAFKATWPCHGIPDNVATISFCFATNGDLVDIEARNDSGYLVDTADFDGPALVALSQDARELRASKGHTMTFSQARADLRAIGMTLHHMTSENEFRVNFANGREVTAYYTADLDDAVNTAHAMKAGRA